MAALTGVMTADFTQFVTEVDRSVVKLKELEGAGARTDSTFTDMADGLGSVDRVLATMGVNLSKPIGAMRELGNVSGVTFEKLGMWGSLGAIGATLAASWQLTTWALEFTTLDEAASKSLATLLGWGDVAAQEAASGADVLARATQIAGREITNFAAAQKIIVDENKRVAESFNTGTVRVQQWSGEIAKVRASGDLVTIERELREGSSTVKQLAEHFNISAEAIQWHTKRTKENATVLNEWRENAAKVTAAQQELNQAGGGWRETLLTITPAAAAAATAYIAMGQNLTTIATAGQLSEIQVRALDRAYKEQIATLAALEPATQSLDTWMLTVGQQFQVAAESGDQFKTMLELTTEGIVSDAVPALEKLDATYRSVTEAAREATAPSKNAPGSVGVNLGGVAFGSVGVEAAMKAYTARFGSGSAAGAIGGGPAPDFLSWAMKMGYATKGTQVSNTFNIVDTESEIARRVSEEISRQIQRGSLVQ